MIASLFRNSAPAALSDQRQEPSVEAFPSTISREVPTAPTGGLTRRILREHTTAQVASLREKIDFSTQTYDAVSEELLASGSPTVNERSITTMLNALFDFEPVRTYEGRTVILAGSTPCVRWSASLALSQKIDLTARRIALFRYNHNIESGVTATFHGGMDVLNVTTAEECIDAIATKEATELGIIDASCLDAEHGDLSTLAKIREAARAEVIYIHSCTSDAAIPDHAKSAGIDRFISTGRIGAAGIGSMLDAAYLNRWAFCGHVSERGIYHTVTPRYLADHLLRALS